MMSTNYNQVPSSLYSRLIVFWLVLVASTIYSLPQIYSRSTFSGDRLSQAAIVLIKERFGEDLEVSVPLPPSDQFFENKNMEAELLLDSKTLSRHMHLTAVFYEDGKMSRKIGITALVRQIIVVPVASKNIRAGERVTVNMIDYDKLDRLTFTEEALINDDLIVNKILLSDIRKGQIFPVDNLTSGTKVKRGEEVELVLIKGTVRVRATATALEDGVPGQSIRLERKGSKKILTATINQEGKAILMN